MAADTTTEPQVTGSGKDGEDEEDETGGTFVSELPPEVIAAAQARLAAPEQSAGGLSVFWQEKYEREAKRNWNVFYKQNQRNAYKDRHWLQREFEEIRVDGVSRVILEVGCGVGNTLFPIVEENPDVFVFGVDFSSTAIELLRSESRFDPTRMDAFVMDLTADAWPDAIPVGKVDCISCLYVLSAIHPSKFATVAQRLFEALRPGARLLFRDYGRYDEAQLRFKAARRLGDNFFCRQNGTRSYYFSLDELEATFGGAGFVTIQNEYFIREVSNRRTGKAFTRVWVQSKFIKPL